MAFNSLSTPSNILSNFLIFIIPASEVLPFFFFTSISELLGIIWLLWGCALCKSASIIISLCFFSRRNKFPTVAVHLPLSMILSLKKLKSESTSSLLKWETMFALGWVYVRVLSRHIGNSSSLGTTFKHLSCTKSPAMSVFHRKAKH